MRRWGRWLAVAAALAFSAAAWAQQTPSQQLEQPPAQAPGEPAQPTVRDLAYKFVHDPESMAFLVEARAEVQKKLDGASARLSPGLKQWFSTAMTDALDTTMADMLPIMEEKLIAAYSEKFTVEELQQILDFQVFVRQPHIAAAVAAAQSQPDSAAKLKKMVEMMPREDMEKMLTATLKHPVLTMTIVTLQVSEETTKEFVQRFQAALTAHCATAPEGIPICKDQGRAL